MKGLKLLGGVGLVLGVVVSAVFAAQIGSTANKPCPIICNSGSVNTVSAAVSQGSVGTAISANTSRMDGYIINVSTNYLRCSLTASTTTGIDAAYFLMYPADDSYDRDKYPLKQNDCVYQGAFYFYGTEAIATGVSTKGAAKVSVWEWK